ncbi:MAG: NAD-binding protein [Pseudomonadota bacterium]
MRVVILGASRFGAALARHLIEAEHEAILIDKDQERLDALSEQLDCGFIRGDGTSPSILREAFQDEHDVFVAITNASDVNILASLVARSVGFGRVIPQITSADLMDVCQEMALEDVINPHATVAESIVAGILDTSEIDQETLLHNELAMKRVHVPDRLAGKVLRDVALPEGTRPVALTRDEREAFLEPDTQLNKGDLLLFATECDAIDALTDTFAE